MACNGDITARRGCYRHTFHQTLRSQQSLAVAALQSFSVPSQRSPSGVWAMELMPPFTKPSRIFHDVCAYWLMSSDVSEAKARGHTAAITNATRGQVFGGLVS